MRCCGNCKYKKYIDGEWVCNCKDSDNYGLETGYSDSCEEHTGKYEN